MSQRGREGGCDPRGRGRFPPAARSHHREERLPERPEAGGFRPRWLRRFRPDGVVAVRPVRSPRAGPAAPADVRSARVSRLSGCCRGLGTEFRDEGGGAGKTPVWEQQVRRPGRPGRERGRPLPVSPPLWRRLCEAAAPGAAPERVLTGTHPRSVWSFSGRDLKSHPRICLNWKSPACSVCYFHFSPSVVRLHVLSALQV